jgi:3-hydroxyisobutyrate dehydrogenase-like beta-hydroxyacid dehydrogenase
MTTSIDISKIRVAMIGYGEVGGVLGRALRSQGVASVRMYDRLLDDPKHRAALVQRARGDGIVPSPTATEAVRHADLVVSAVTASQARAAVKGAATGLRAGAIVVDVNSASPGSRIDCAAIVHAAGGRYVEMAVMTSVPPKGLATPMLSGGPDAAGAAPLLAALGFNVEPASEKYGVASAIKMCRSVVVKGMEAIVIESFVTARKYGVEKQVLASLAESFPGIDWEKQGGYFFQRAIQHGRRRAEEMQEAAVTVREAGLEPLLASATAKRQAWMADLLDAGVFKGSADGKAAWRENADAMIRVKSEALDAND